MRISPIAPADLSEEQKPLFEAMRAGVSAKYSDFVTTRSDGAMLGPWSAWLADPEVGSAFWKATAAMTKARRIPDAARQVSIIATGAHFGAAYEIYAHTAVARTKHDMSDRRLTTLAAGERPDDLDDEEALAFDLTKALLRGGVLPDLIYQRALDAFGQSGTNELIYLVGHYCFVSLTLNGFAIAVPSRSKGG